MFKNLVLLLLYFSCFGFISNVVIKKDSNNQENWTPTLPTPSLKRAHKRGISFSPMIVHPSVQSASVMGNNYIPMFIVRPISDERMNNMFAQKPLHSYSGHSTNWIENNMEWKNMYKQPHHVLFKNPDLNKAPKIVRIFLPVQSHQMPLYTKYHDTYSKPVSPLHTSIVSSKEVGLKNVYPYNPNPPLIYKAPLKPVKPLPAPFDSNQFTSISQHTISPTIPSYANRPTYVVKQIRPMYHYPTSHSYHGFNGNHLGLGHYSTMHHQLPSQSITSKTPFIPVHQFTKNELASTMQSSKHSYLPLTAMAATVSPLVGPQDFQPISAPQFYHRPKHPTLSPYHITSGPQYVKHSSSIPVKDYLAPSSHYTESHTTNPGIQYYVPQEIDHTNADNEVDDETNYEAQLGTDGFDEEQQVAHTAHASITVQEKDRTPSSEQKVTHQQYDHETSRRKQAQPKAFGLIRYPLSLEQYSPLNPKVPPEHVNSPYLFKQNHQVLPLPQKNNQPQLKFLAEHGTINQQSRPGASTLSTILFPISTTTPFSSGTHIDRSIRPVKEENNDTRREYYHSNGVEETYEGVIDGKENSEVKNLVTENRSNSTVGIKEMKAAIVSTLRQERCEEKCVTESKIEDKGEATCGSDGNIYKTKTQLLCANKCGRTDLKPQLMKNCQEK